MAGQPRLLRRAAVAPPAAGGAHGGRAALRRPSRRALTVAEAMTTLGIDQGVAFPRGRDRVDVGAIASLTPAELGRRYRELAKAYHPDCCADGTERMKEINAAYSLLREELNNSGSSAEAQGEGKPGQEAPDPRSAGFDRPPPPPPPEEPEHLRRRREEAEREAERGRKEQDEWEARGGWREERPPRAREDLAQRIRAAQGPAEYDIRASMAGFGEAVCGQLSTDRVNALNAWMNRILKRAAEQAGCMQDRKPPTIQQVAREELLRENSGSVRRKSTPGVPAQGRRGKWL